MVWIWKIQTCLKGSGRYSPSRSLGVIRLLEAATLWGGAPSDTAVKDGMSLLRGDVDGEDTTVDGARQTNICDTSYAISWMGVEDRGMTSYGPADAREGLLWNVYYFLEWYLFWEPGFQLQALTCWLGIGHLKFFDEGKIRCVWCCRNWDP